jgi:signal transduction histidine kinase
VSVAASVASFTAAGLVVTLALAALTGLLARWAGENQARRAFEDLSVVAAAGLAPLVDADPAAADEARKTDLHRQVDALRSAGPLVRVKVWDGGGRVLWSDEPAVVGQVFPVEADAEVALREGGVVSEVVDPDEPENRSESGLGPLVAAYVGVRDRGGTPLLIEFYERYDAVTTAARAAWLRFTPAAIGALLVLELVQVPLAWGLARRLRRAQEEQAALYEAAAGASEAERRRIASEVHDTVVQDLTGLTYDLDAARLRGGLRDPGDTALLSRTAEGVRRAVADLRALLVRLTPPRPTSRDLDAALAAFAPRLASTGTRLVLRDESGEDLPAPVVALLHRCAQEALRNVVTHSRAETVEISVIRDEGGVTMVVDDDGCGFDEEQLADRTRDGHLGLRALAELVADTGGSLTASSAPGQGTRLVVRLPLDGSMGDLAGVTR